MEAPEAGVCTGLSIQWGMVLNVRLSADDERVVRGLRRAGVNVSALVRRAIREAKPPKARKKAPRPSEVLQEIFARYPVPPESRRGQPRLDDRKAMSAWLKKKMAGK